MAQGIKGSTPPCSIPGCWRLGQKRGWCNTHYWHWRRYGDPLAGKNTKWHEPLNWLKEQVASRDRQGRCWEWPFGTPDKIKYGSLWFEGRTYHAHIVALMLDGQPRPAPPNHFCLHACDNPSCVNPEHLRWGSVRDNSQDMVERGRASRGEHRPTSKLTEAQVRAIRLDTRPATKVGPDFGVSPSAISKIRKGTMWKYLV